MCAGGGRVDVVIAHAEIGQHAAADAACGLVKGGGAELVAQRRQDRVILGQRLGGLVGGQADCRFAQGYVEPFAGKGDVGVRYDPGDQQFLQNIRPPKGTS